LSRTDAALSRLAESFGIETTWVDPFGDTHPVSNQTLRALVAALGCEVADPVVALAAREQALSYQLAPPAITVWEHEAGVIPVRVFAGDSATVILRLESGLKKALVSGTREVISADIEEVQMALPHDLPVGIHQGEAIADDGRREVFPVVVAPQHLDLPESLADGSALGIWGSLFQARSGQSWGIGEYSDLLRLARWGVDTMGADFFAFGPMSAPPTLRRSYVDPSLTGAAVMRNPLFIAVHDLPELEQLSEDTHKAVFELGERCRVLNHSGQLDYVTLWALKREALELIWSESAPGPEFAEFCTEEVLRWGTWCAIDEGVEDAPWPEQFARSDGRLTGIFAQAHGDRVLFYCWLQWCAHQQLNALTTELSDLGCMLGLMPEVTTQTNRDGADAWHYQDLVLSNVAGGINSKLCGFVATDTAVWSPDEYARSAAQPLRDAIQAWLRYGSGIRISGLSDLAKIWVVPDGLAVEQGAFLRYDLELVLAVAMIEVSRAGGVLVVSENLDRDQNALSELLEKRGVFGTSVLWEERDAEGPKSVDLYRVRCLATVGHVALPPSAGFLDLVHATPANRRAELERVDQVRLMLHELGVVNFGAQTPDYILGLHRFLVRSPAKLIGLSLNDLVGDRRTVVNYQVSAHPDWQLALTNGEGRVVSIESLYGEGDEV
jgi:4-alpha-glucanotransferase